MKIRNDSPSRSDTLRTGRRAGRWTGGSTAERAGTRRGSRGDRVAAGGRREDTTLPRGNFAASVRLRSTSSKLSTAPSRGDQARTVDVSNGSAGRPEQGAGSTVRLRRKNLRCDQSDIR